MELKQYVKQTFPIQCKGRDANGLEVLTEPVNVNVKIHKSPGSNTISSNVECPYNTGGHGQRCKASHPDVDKVGEGVGCPYSFDIPYALEREQQLACNS
ncbi:MAG: hypothetical protein AABX73_01795 [Nanoarchaeota archaeon]